jgi:CBS domain-containing protein
MNWNASTIENLRRVFTEGFAVRDIAEPLVSFDAGTPAAEVAALMDRRGYNVVGIRTDGVVAAYVERAELRGATCGVNARPIEPSIIIADSSPLADAVLGLAESPRLFVRVLGALGGIVTRSDLEKPPVRMWLFGMITLMEMRAARLIELTCPGDTWKQYLSESRLQKAEALLEERRRRSQDLELIDCLQISDKGQIIARHEEIRRLTRMQSRRQTEQAIKMLESLRNNLAHAQDIVSCDWETIVELCRDMERVIGGTEEVQQALGAKTHG